MANLPINPEVVPQLRALHASDGKPTKKLSKWSKNLLKQYYIERGKDPKGPRSDPFYDKKVKGQ